LYSLYLFFVRALGETSRQTDEILSVARITEREENNESEEGENIRYRADIALQEINSGAYYQRSFRAQIDF
jgi:hypothetical protein